MPEKLGFNEYFALIKECYSFRDRVAILFHLLTSPLSYFKDNPNSLPFDIRIKNEDGIFLCGDNIFSARCVSTACGHDIRGYFNLDEGVFVDVGANIGKYTVALGRRLSGKGKVVAIEPEDYNYELLGRNVELNGLDNVTLEKCACYSRNGTMNLYLNPTRRGQHSLLVRNGKRASIKTRKLDDILADNQVTNVKLIKIDVEGAEIEVLKGAVSTLKKDHPKIIFEAWNNSYLNTIRQFLLEKDYRISPIGKKNYLAY